MKLLALEEDLEDVKEEEGEGEGEVAAAGGSGEHATSRAIDVPGTRDPGKYASLMVRVCKRPQ